MHKELSVGEENRYQADSTELIDINTSFLIMNSQQGQNKAQQQICRAIPDYQ